MPPFQKKSSVIESVHGDDVAVATPKIDRRDTVKIGDPGIVWRAPNATLDDQPLPAIVLKVGGRRTLSLYVFTDSGTRVVRGARHWTDPDFQSPGIDTTQLSSWSFNDE